MRKRAIVAVLVAGLAVATSAQPASSVASVTGDQVDDPCKAIGTKKLTTWESVSACYKSFPITSTERRAHIQALQTYFEIYPYTDLLANATIPLFLSTLPIRTTLATLAHDATLTTLFAFQSRVRRFFLALRDAHASYTPTCFNAFRFSQPWHLGAVWEADGGVGVEIVGEVWEGLAGVWEGWRGLGEGRYVGWRVVEVDGVDVVRAIEAHASRFVGYSRSPSSRFNRALHSRLYTSGKWLDISGTFYETSFLDPSTPFNRTYLLRSKTGVNVTVRVPWLAVNLRSGWGSSGEYFQRFCRVSEGLRRRGEEAGLEVRLEEGQMEVKREVREEEGMASRDRYRPITAAVYAQAEALSQKIRPNALAEALFAQARNQTPTTTADGVSRGDAPQRQQQTRVLPELTQPLVSDAWTAFYLLDDGRTGVWVFPTLAPDGAFNEVVPGWLATVVAGLRALERSGATRLLIDVSGNGGGYACIANALLKYLVKDPSIIIDQIRLTPTAKALLDAGFFGPNQNELSPINATSVLAAPLPTQVRGGTLGTFTRFFTFACEGEEPPFPLRPLDRGWAPQHIAVLSNGGCGSACACFVRSLRDSFGVKAVVYGGASPANYTPTSFEGGIGGAFEDFVLGSQSSALNAQTLAALPKSLPNPPARGNLPFTQGYSPMGRYGLEWPAEWVPQPAEAWVGVGKQWDTVGLWRAAVGVAFAGEEDEGNEGTSKSVPGIAVVKSSGAGGCTLERVSLVARSPSSPSSFNLIRHPRHPSSVIGHQPSSSKGSRDLGKDSLEVGPPRRNKDPTERRPDIKEPSVIPEEPHRQIEPTSTMFGLLKKKQQQPLHQSSPSPQPPTKQPPDNTTPDGRWTCALRRDRHHFFISYRVRTEQNFATLLVLELEGKLLTDSLLAHAFLDFRCLGDDLTWETNFPSGLASADVVVCLVSMDCLESIKSNTLAGREDNVLLEWFTARRQQKLIVPVIIRTESEVAAANGRCVVAGFPGLSYATDPELRSVYVDGKPQNGTVADFFAWMFSLECMAVVADDAHAPGIAADLLNFWRRHAPAIEHHLAASAATPTPLNPPTLLSSSSLPTSTASKPSGGSFNLFKKKGYPQPVVIRGTPSFGIIATHPSTTPMGRGGSAPSPGSPPSAGPGMQSPSSGGPGGLPGGFPPPQQQQPGIVPPTMVRGPAGYPQPQSGMPPQGMPPQGMPAQGMPPQGMPPQGIPPQGMPPQGIPFPGNPGGPFPGSGPHPGPNPGFQQPPGPNPNFPMSGGGPPGPGPGGYAQPGPQGPNPGFPQGYPQPGFPQQQPGYPQQPGMTSPTQPGFPQQQNPPFQQAPPPQQPQQTGPAYPQFAPVMPAGTSLSALPPPTTSSFANSSLAPPPPPLPASTTPAPIQVKLPRPEPSPPTQPAFTRPRASSAAAARGLGYFPTMVGGAGTSETPAKPEEPGTSGRGLGYYPTMVGGAGSSAPPPVPAKQNEEPGTSGRGLGYYPTMVGGANVSTPTSPTSPTSTSTTAKSTALHMAIVQNNLQQLSHLLATSAVPVNAPDDNHSTPLYVASLMGRADAAGLLLTHGADPHIRNRKGDTPLYVAASRRELGVLQTLLAAGASVDSRNRHGITALASAAHHNHADVMGVLLKAGASPVAADDRGEVALHAAAGRGRIEAVAVLLEDPAGRRAQLDARNVDGETPLHKAAGVGSAGVVKVLVRMGAEVGVRDGSGRTAVDVAREMGGEAVVRVLEEEMARVTPKAPVETFSRPLPTPQPKQTAGAPLKPVDTSRPIPRPRTVSMAPPPREVRDALAAGSGSGSGSGSRGSSAADPVSRPASAAAGRDIGPQSAPVSVGQLAYSPPTAPAPASRGKARATEHPPATSLAGSPSSGAGRSDAYRSDPYAGGSGSGSSSSSALNVTKLHAAAAQGNLDQLRVLVLQDQTPVNASDERGYTALHAAAMSGQPDAVRELLELGADPESRTSADGRTALHVAAMSQDRKVVRALLELGATPDARDAQGRTPLYWVVAQGGKSSAAASVMAALLKGGGSGGASPTVAGNDGCLPLHAAAEKGRVEVARALLESWGGVSAREQVDWVNKRGETPLHRAASAGMLEMVEFLAGTWGARVNVKDVDGDVPLDAAIKTGQVEVVKFLREVEKRERAKAAAQASAVLAAAAAAGSMGMAYDVGSSASSIASLSLGRSHRGGFDNASISDAGGSRLMRMQEDAMHGWSQGGPGSSKGVGRTMTASTRGAAGGSNAYLGVPSSGVSVSGRSSMDGRNSVVPPHLLQGGVLTPPGSPTAGQYQQWYNQQQSPSQQRKSVSYPKQAPPQGGGYPQQQQQWDAPPVAPPPVGVGYINQLSPQERAWNQAKGIGK
ncbi:hypothetical protein HDU96_001446 [Phlyctochytrium bullatum]|nr:hypothetical protein HDU96_001446 [Phlyctochytrium bullatum]